MIEATNPSIRLGARSVAEAPFIVPYQRLPLNAGDIYARYGPAHDDVWNVYGEGTLHPGSLVEGASLSTVKPRAYANCASCSVTLQVQNHHPSSYILCSLCQSRQASIKLRPAIRSQNRVNPYPLPPVPTGIPTLDSPFIFPHPSTAFTVEVPPQNASVNTSVNGKRSMFRVCMRYGCGARLPTHNVGDMCEACTSAGFVRPPPAVVPKRVPRRAKERTHPLPRESIGLVRASLLREAQAIQESRPALAVPPESQDVDDSMDLDLVYPEDTVETVHSSNVESTVQGRDPPADEDADIDLELVYPEDAAEAARKSEPNSRTRLPSRASSSASFIGGLQTIPALDMAQSNNSTPANANPTPLRQCIMTGCNETLTSVTLQRCVNCSLGYWKQRKQAAIDARSTPSGVVPGSPTTAADTPVVMASDNQGLVIKLPKASLAGDIAAFDNTQDRSLDVEEVPEDDVPLPSSSPTSKGSDGPVADLTIDSVPGWDSDLTDLSSSEDEETESESEVLKISIPVLVNRRSLDGSFQKCANKRCNIALSKDHRWKTCEPCRRAQRQYQRVRNENIRRRVAGVEDDEGTSSEPPVPYDPTPGYSRWRSLSADPEIPEIELIPETSRPCSVRNCRTRIPLPEVYRWKTCATCRARARRDARKKRDAYYGLENSTHLPRLASPLPTYQNRAVLLSSLGIQLGSFVEGQILYLRSKLHENGEGELSKLSPMAFAFDGEYSAVTASRDEENSQSQGEDVMAMREEVHGVVEDFNRALRTKFKSAEAFAIDIGGIIMRFTCLLELIAPLRPLPLSVKESESSLRHSESGEIEKEKSPSPVPLIKTLSGELEVMIMPDNSHKLFHGRRTIIRYRMLG